MVFPIFALGWDWEGARIDGALLKGKSHGHIATALGSTKRLVERFWLSLVQGHTLPPMTKIQLAIGVRTAIRSVLAAGLLTSAGLFAAEPKRAPRPDTAGQMPRPTTAELDDTLAIGGEDIDARKVRTRMTVAVAINGVGPYRFVVDSGADTSVVGERLARFLKLPSGTPILLNGVTESARVNRVLVDSLVLGPTSVFDLELPVLNDADIGGEGIIGLDALVEQRLMLDFEKRTISVDEASRPAPRLDGEIVVTARLKRGQLILTQVRAGKTPIEAVVDTGSELTIGNTALRDQLLRKSPDSFETIEAVGVTGTRVTFQVGRIPKLKLGSITFEDVPIAFADIPPFKVFGIADQPALLLGTDLMENFRKVSLDFRARKVRFQLRRCGASGILLSTSRSYGVRLTSDKTAPAVCAR